MKNVALLLALIFASISTATFGQTERDIETGILSLKQQASAPSSPASGKFKAYVRDGKMRIKSSAGVESTVGTGGGSRLNLLTDASFEDGVTEGSCTTCTASQESSALMVSPTNLKSLKMSFTASTGDYTISKTTGSEFLGVPGAVSCWIKTTQSGIRFIARKDGSDLDTSMGLYKDVIADGVARPYEIPIVMGSTSNGYKVKATSSITGDVYVDECHVGPAKLTAETIAIGPWVAYTPTFGAGVGTAASISFFYRQLGSDIEVQGNFTAGTVAASLVSISLPSGFTLDTTKISKSNTTSGQGMLVGESRDDNNAGGHSTIVTATGTSTTAVYVGGSGGSTVMLIPTNGNSVYVSSSVVGIRFKVPVVELRGSVSTYSSFNADFGWKSFTPTGGWTTNATYAGKYKRVGDSALIQYKVSVSSSPTGSTLYFDMPAGLTIDSSKLEVTSVGYTGLFSSGIAWDSSAAGGWVLYGEYQGNTSQIVAMVASASGTYTQRAGVTTTVPFSTAASDSYTLTVLVPVTNWDTGNTIVGSFQDMVGSFGSSSGSDIQAVLFGAGSDCETACSTGSCTICTQIGTRITSVTYQSAGNYRINGIDGTKYVCIGGGMVSGTTFGNVMPLRASSTSTYAAIATGASTSSINSARTGVICFGKP